MGIFSKLFYKNELELHDEKEELDNEMTKQSKDEKKTEQNTEPSPFLVDNDSDEE